MAFESSTFKQISAYLCVQPQALAFVLDVDELVADVLLTERLRSTLGKLQPLTCGKILKRDARWIPGKDS